MVDALGVGQLTNKSLAKDAETLLSGSISTVAVAVFISTFTHFKYVPELLEFASFQYQFDPSI